MMETLASDSVRAGAMETSQWRVCVSGPCSRGRGGGGGPGSPIQQGDGRWRHMWNKVYRIVTRFTRSGAELYTYLEFCMHCDRLEVDLMDRL